MSKCQGLVKKLDNQNLEVTVTVSEPLQNREIFYVAAAPYDRRATYTGSGLPFPNPTVAFENTPNVGKETLDVWNRCVIKLITPNTYLDNLGTVTVPPTLYIRYKTATGIPKEVAIRLVDGVPYRSLSYPNLRDSPSFYGTQFCLIPKSQEDILYDSRYPLDNSMPNNHWGKKPPL